VNTDDLILKLETMADRKTRYHYGVGDYWNALGDAADALREAQQEIKMSHDDHAFVIEERDAALRELKEAQELHRMQLAAIGVSAMCNTRGTAAQQRIGRDNPYWTLALEDVYRAVDREMAERERADAAELQCVAWG
jgi:hypothetical protein